MNKRLKINSVDKSVKLNAKNLLQVWSHKFSLYQMMF